ncbi:hypothetical protein HON36_04700 [Candidatus Parcubacteria bacterium]|jgi:hypothetical protein|nr:hypothetical protein [Candidatus Parcubacteria bacterium]
MKILKILTGFVVIVILASIFGRGQGLAFLAMSIICTAGISLVAYVPLSLLLGEIVFKIFKWDQKEEKKLKKIEEIIKKTQGDDKKDSPKTGNQNEILTLVEYIGKSETKGMSKERIMSDLKGTGWREEDIKQAMEIAAKYKDSLSA